MLHLFRRFTFLFCPSVYRECFRYEYVLWWSTFRDKTSMRGVEYVRLLVAVLEIHTDGIWPIVVMQPLRNAREIMHSLSAKHNEWLRHPLFAHALKIAIHSLVHLLVHVLRLLLLKSRAARAGRIPPRSTWTSPEDIRKPVSTRQHTIHHLNRSPGRSRKVNSFLSLSLL